MLVSVQYARALAAILVVFAHLAGFEAFRALTSTEFGGMGVDIFFVISGFIMWETSKAQRPAEFFRRRILRIVPAYWFYTSLLVALAAAAPRLTPNVQFDLKALLGSYFFVPYTNFRGETNPILLQGWTLNFEMYFYLIFALSLFIADRLRRFIFVASVFITSVILGSKISSSIAVLMQVTSPMLLEFVLGMLLSASIGHFKTTIANSVVMVSIAIALLFLAGMSDFPGYLRPVYYGLPAVTLLWGMVGLEPCLSKSPSQILLAVGDSSYSLYLAHPFVLSAIHILINGPFRTYTGIQGGALSLVFGLVALATSCAVGYVSFCLIEKPTASFFGGLFSRKRNRPAAVRTAD